jgi:hypothetical protein
MAFMAFMACTRPRTRSGPRPRLPHAQLHNALPKRARNISIGLFGSGSEGFADTSPMTHRISHSSLCCMDAPGFACAFTCFGFLVFAQRSEHSGMDALTSFRRRREMRKVCLGGAPLLLCCMCGCVSALSTAHVVCCCCCCCVQAKRAAGVKAGAGGRRATGECHCCWMLDALIRDQCTAGSSLTGAHCACACQAGAVRSVKHLQLAVAAQHT